MTRSNQINMTEGPIFSKLLKFSIPLILSSVLQLLFNAADVVVEEPMKADNPLLTAKNTVITPHIAWAPKETRARLQKIAFENLTGWLIGNPINVVS